MKSSQTSQKKTWRKLCAWLLIWLMSARILPVCASAPNAAARVHLSTGQSGVHMSGAAPRRHTSAELTKAQARQLVFSDNPSDLEISNARVFFEPLIPTESKSTIAENKELAQALLAFKGRKNSEDISALDQFVKHNPHSRWTPSLQTAIADERFESGYYRDALRYLACAWEATGSLKGQGAKAVADLAVSQLVLLEARLGLTKSLEKHLAQIGKRRLTGSIAQRVHDAKGGLWAQQHTPAMAFKCGPFAVNTIANLLNPAHPMGCSETIKNAASTDHGTNLAQVEDLSRRVGLKMRMAKRSAGAKIVVPSIVHFSIGHFAAIVNEKDGRYQIQDPTFGEKHNNWVTLAALNSETDGYFLIPDHDEPGYTEVARAEAESVFGKGYAVGRDNKKTSKTPQQNPGPSCPVGSNGPAMAVASAFSMNASLIITDHPLAYSPPAGPPIDIECRYIDGAGNQPGTFTFTNLGYDWSLNWVSYLTVDASNNVTVRVRDGGYEVYDYPYVPDLNSQAQIVNLGSGSYQRQLPNGSVENFTLSDGTNTYMTSVVDPQGNAATISYDANYRVTGVTDACGNPQTTFSYVSNTPGNSGFYKVATITDGFGRSASFSYDATNTFLTSITDAVGNVSQFFYDQSSSFITMMTTPYGSTSFYKYSQGTQDGLRFNFPDGTTSVIENWIGEQKETYYWDREATALYPTDPVDQNYTHCETFRWLWEQGPNTEAPVANWVRPALESPVVYTYPGETNQDFCGTSDKPTQVARQLRNSQETFTVGGTPAYGDVPAVTIHDPYLTYTGGTIYCYYAVQPGDTTASVAAGLAAAVNAQPMVQAFGMTASAASNVMTITSLSIVQPTYTPTASGGTTLTAAVGPNPAEIAGISGSVTAGDTLTLTVHDSGLSGGQESVSYVAQAGDTLVDIAQALSLAINADSNLQAIGVSGMWNSPGSGTGSAYMQSNSTNTTTYSSSTSGGATETISLSASSAGIVQAWNFQRNTLGYATQMVDPIGRTFNYSYAANNIDLLQVLPSGSSSQTN